MGVPQIGKIISVVADPMVSDHFTLEFPNVPTGSQDEEPLMVQCQQATKPGMTINEVQVQLFGHTLVYGGNLSYNHDLSITFVESVRGNIMRTFEKWMEKIRGHETQHGDFKADYAISAYLSIYDNVGDLALKYQLFNVWPGQMPDTTFDGSNANLITHAMSIKFDYYKCIGGKYQ